MTLTRQADKIVGVISGQQGDIGIEAEVKEKAVSMWASVPTQNGSIDITFTGTADGNTMKGTVDFGGQGGGDWTATRAAAPPAAAPAPPADKAGVDVTGTWNFEVTTEFGTGSSTMTFKQDGGKITGKYSGQYGEAELTGSIKGNEIAFSYELVRESMTAVVSYSGTVEKDRMKGTLSIGDMGNGSFTAVKAR